MRRPLAAVAVTCASFGIDIDDVDRAEDFAVLRRGRVEQRERGLARIDREVAVAQQRGRPCDAEPRAKLLAVEKAAREARGAARLVLAHQLVAVEHIAREIKRIAHRDVGDAKLLAAAPPAHRPQAASAARRAPRPAVPILRASLISGVSISYCTSAVLAVVEPLAGPRRSTTATFKPLSRKRVGQHRPGDAGADHQHVGFDIAS